MQEAELNSLYKQMLDAIPDLILVKGAHSHILWANKAFRDYYGMSNEQLRDLIDSPMVEPDMTQSYIRDDAHVFNTGQVLDIPSEPIKRHDGVIRQFHTVKSPIRDADGKVIMTIGISRDIEDRLQNEGLKTKLIQAEKLTAVGQLAAGIAHEMNNPLSVILGFAESSQKRLDPKDPTHASMGSIVRESVRCKLLVQNLMNFSRHKMPILKFEDPQVLLNDTLNLMDNQFVARKVCLIRQFTETKQPVAIDRLQLEQVIVNLCTNALDAMPGGGDLVIASRYQNMAWIFTVTDTGKGIPENDAARIFEPFFTTKEVGRGTGLGLSLCYRIIQNHKGQLTFQRGEKKGTTFTVELPLSVPSNKSETRRR